MSPEAQRIAIAEACGWHSIKSVPSTGDERYTLWGCPSDYKQTNLPTLLVPDYLNDLNAMHAAEDIFENYGALRHHEWWGRYSGWLANVLGTPLDFMPQYTSSDYAKHTHATAAQRAEAFLKTIGKWTDSPQ